ncbi:N-acyl-D-amino-acid deacylase family protein [Cohnella rhizosphaerae]|uniref:Amidohydrolase family protein n=1 Tax=Cohnella rhizosphaerae TaxID=1457232 RepID=A0A9X4KXK8_9BACL|nr:amidohydrolase family protein [Cohnella rhizosphaerae]MDG0812720.1 amidohydrolase family protein [Cohnella rhizosphaerae]
MEITFDQYPYTAGSTLLQTILPPWMHEEGSERCLERLANAGIRNRIKQDFLDNDSFENWVKNCGWRHIVIASVDSERNKPMEGMSISDIAERRNIDPADAAFDLIVEERGAVSMIVHWGVEADVMTAMKHPFQLFGSDSIFGSKPHPRLYGTYPRVLGRYVRDLNALSMPQAIRQMTGAPAQLLRLKDRGLLREGMHADVVIFDPAAVADRSTYSQPLLEPAGIEYVIVNGQIAVQNGKFMNVSAGRVIRGGRLRLRGRQPLNLMAGLKMEDCRISSAVFGIYVRRTKKGARGNGGAVLEKD